MMRWAICDADGTIRNIVEASRAGLVTANCPDGCVAHECPDRVVTASGWRWGAAGFEIIPAPAETLAQVKARLSASIMSTAEGMKMAVRSPGNGKSGEYRLKKDEAEISGGLLASAVNALTRASALQQYPGAEMEAQLTGEPRAAVLARYRTRSSASDIETLRVSAIEQNGKRLVAAATTIAGAQAAFDAVNWNWKPAA